MLLSASKRPSQYFEKKFIINFAPSKSEVYEFLQNPKLAHGVLGYLDSDAQPDTAFISFSATKDLSIIFGTSETSRKFTAIKANPNAAFNITDKDRRYTVQLKGQVRELSLQELVPFEDEHYAKLGEASRKFKTMPDQHFFIIEPTYFKFTDCSSNPWVITQLI